MACPDIRDEVLTWGKAKGTMNKEKKFYCSFFFQGEEYKLYDNVVVHDENEPDGHVAKIMKLWEDMTTGSKMTLLRWFIRWEELPPHLKAGKDSCESSRELFLAFGLGKGVCNENKLDCIERKCRVLCMSKDVRNKQPCEEDIRDSEYIYMKVYNVDRKRLSNLEGIVKILGPDVLFNKPEWVSDKHSNKQDVAIDVDVQSAPESGQQVCQADCEKGSRDGEDLERKIVLSECKSASRGVKRSGSTIEHGKEKRIKFDGSTKHETLRTSKGMTFSSSPPPVTRSASAKKTEQHATKVEMPSIEEKKFSTVEGITSNSEDSLLKNSRRFENFIPTCARSEQIQCQANILLQKAMDMNIEESLHLGKVVLLHNLNPSFTSADIHDLMSEAFKGCLGGQILTRCLASSSSFVQAFLVFETEDLAKTALHELEENCLVLSGCERPLVASKVESPELGRVLRFPGHFPLDKFKLWKQGQLDLMSKTFDTFHFSEPNSVEFEMAMEWKMLQRMICSWWDRLNKIQEEEITALQNKEKKPKLIIP